MARVAKATSISLTAGMIKTVDEIVASTNREAGTRRANRSSVVREAIAAHLRRHEYIVATGCTTSEGD